LPRENAFDLGARSGYSLSSPQEFYAEGYAAFHSNQETNQARMLAYAPELFGLLESEAKQGRLPTPNRTSLAKYNYVAPVQ
jgi:hypothetical protein